VHQRQSTIERIAGEVVRRQEGFLRNGVQHLRPMKMQDIADAVGVHISTVSRAISGKFIETPQGIFDMKRFFSGGTQSDDGEMVSQQAVKDTLKQIVEGEDKNAPLSDDQLVEELGKKGVHIARRTVTKYRKALGIDSSTRRRQF
jgi:RNA polymerase sigma-54 factor